MCCTIYILHNFSPDQAFDRLYCCFADDILLIFCLFICNQFRIDKCAIVGKTEYIAACWIGLIRSSPCPYPVSASKISELKLSIRNLCWIHTDWQIKVFTKMNLSKPARNSSPPFSTFLAPYIYYRNKSKAVLSLLVTHH